MRTRCVRMVWVHRHTPATTSFSRLGIPTTRLLVPFQQFGQAPTLLQCRRSDSCTVLSVPPYLLQEGPAVSPSALRYSIDGWFPTIVLVLHSLALEGMNSVRSTLKVPLNRCSMSGLCGFNVYLPPRRRLHMMSIREGTRYFTLDLLFKAYI